MAGALINCGEVALSPPWPAPMLTNMHAHTAVRCLLAVALIGSGAFCGDDDGPGAAGGASGGHSASAGVGAGQASGGAGAGTAGTAAGQTGRCRCCSRQRRELGLGRRGGCGRRGGFEARQRGRDPVCASGQHCELVQVTCIRAPCPPQPMCVSDASMAAGGGAGAGGATGVSCGSRGQTACPGDRAASIRLAGTAGPRRRRSVPSQAANLHADLPTGLRVRRPDLRQQLHSRERGCQRAVHGRSGARRCERHRLRPAQGELAARAHRSAAAARCRASSTVATPTASTSKPAHATARRLPAVQRIHLPQVRSPLRPVRVSPVPLPAKHTYELHDSIEQPGLWRAHSGRFRRSARGRVARSYGWRSTSRSSASAARSPRSVASITSCTR